MRRMTTRRGELWRSRGIVNDVLLRVAWITAAGSMPTVREHPVASMRGMGC